MQLPEDHVKPFSSWLRVYAKGGVLSKSILLDQLRALFLYDDTADAPTTASAGGTRIPEATCRGGLRDRTGQDDDEGLLLLQALQQERDESFVQQQTELLWALLSIHGYDPLSRWNDDRDGTASDTHASESHGHCSRRVLRCMFFPFLRCL